jgi:PAS domain S-box-containing protein
MAASAVYVGLFVWLTPTLGGGVAGLSVIPVGLVAWLYGMRAGVGAGLAGIPLQVLAFALVQEDGWSPELIARVVPGALGVVLVGAVVGRLRDLQIRLLTEAALRDRTDKALRLESEITSHMAEGVFLVRSSDGVIVYTNSKCDEMFGYPEGELVGQHVAAVNAPGDRSPIEVADEIKEALDKSGEWSGEVHNTRKDGSTFWSHAAISPFEHDEYGQVWVSVQADITARKAIEAQLLQANERLETTVVERTTELQEAVERLSSVISQAPIILWALDDDGVFTLSEGKGLEDLGLQPGEHVGMSVFDVYPDSTTLLEGVRLALSGLATVATVRIGDIVFDSHKSPIVAEDGTVQGVIGVSTVITERELAERRLTASQARFTELLEITQNAVISVDGDWRITRFNQSAEKIFGYQPSEAIGQPLSMLLPERFRGTHLPTPGQLCRGREPPPDDGGAHQGVRLAERRQRVPGGSLAFKACAGRQSCLHGYAGRHHRALRCGERPAEQQPPAG